MSRIFPQTAQFHFVGIGGIGMSALAKVMRARGHIVSGSDANTQTRIITELRSLGCIIYTGHNQDNVKPDSSVIYSTAISPSNPEILAAHQKSCLLAHRSELLASLLSEGRSVGITGTHGKTTTSSLLGHIVIVSGSNPTFIGGGILKNIGSNAHIGSDDLFIAEVDESDKSLLRYNCTYALLTNVEYDHVEHYHSLDEVKKTFVSYLNASKEHIFISNDDTHTQGLRPQIKLPTTTFGFSAGSDIRGNILTLAGGHSTFEVLAHEKKLGTIKLPLQGSYNVQNALAAISVSLHLGISFDECSQALASFEGIARRFEHKGSFQGATIFDDYGHHPTEIACTLEAARTRAQKKLIVIFEPHRYSRTKELWDDFVTTLTRAPIDELYLTDIYPASEAPLDGINSVNLVSAINKRSPKVQATYLASYKVAKQMAQERLSNGDVLITLGAGGLFALAQELANEPLSSSR